MKKKPKLDTWLDFSSKLKKKLNMKLLLSKKNAKTKKLDPKKIKKPPRWSDFKKKKKSTED